MKLSNIMHGLLALALTAGAARAEDEPKKEGKAAKGGKGGDMAAMMAAYEKAAMPGEPHKQLLRTVGKWDLALKSWQDPSQPPMESKGTAETKAILGDRFIQTQVESTFMGKPFSGVGLMGYDNTK